MTLRRVTLRWRLVAAFLAVSVPPVLVASYVAAELISYAFQHNVERWMGEAADFLVNDTLDSQNEADRAATILAKTLPEQDDTAAADLGTETPQLKVFSDLLSSVGYDLVLIYDDRENILYRHGTAVLDDQLPRTTTRSVFTAHKDDRPALLIGAARVVERKSGPLHVLVANLLDDNFFSAPQNRASIVIHVFRLQGDSLLPLTGEAPGSQPLPLSGEVLTTFSKGDSYTVGAAQGASRLANGYGAIRDNAGQLVGVLTFGLAGRGAAFEQLINWRLFLVLALIASSLSVTVGLVLARRLTVPLQALKQGLREVAAGNYAMRLPERGGPEIEEVTSGFNIMSSQLERLHQMENEMRRRQQFAALGEAAAVIAHEIRNPLGIIKTSTQVVRQRSYLAPPEERLLGFVLEEVDRIDRLVADILDYVRPRQPNTGRIDLDKIVQEAAAFLAPELARRGVSHKLDAVSGSFVEADADQMHQIVMNLALNAMEAMPDGGELSIGARPDAAKDEAVLIVADTGAGMEPEVMQRMFDPFFTTRAKGTGLGLAKVQGVVEQHGGTIACQSEPDHGTRIVIRFPLSRAR